MDGKLYRLEVISNLPFQPLVWLQVPRLRSAIQPVIPVLIFIGSMAAVKGNVVKSLSVPPLPRIHARGFFVLATTAIERRRPVSAVVTLSLRYHYFRSSCNRRRLHAGGLGHL